jgi:hypothetical protein
LAKINRSEDKQKESDRQKIEKEKTERYKDIAEITEDVEE